MSKNSQLPKWCDVTPTSYQITDPLFTATPRDGGWSEYGDWGFCSTDCGGGFKTRKRTCDNPTPRFGGKDCIGDDTEVSACNTEPCPGQGIIVNFILVVWNKTYISGK